MTRRNSRSPGHSTPSHIGPLSRRPTRPAPLRGCGVQARGAAGESSTGPSSRWSEKREQADMCKLCDAGFPQTHFGTRRDFLKTAAATGVAAGGLNLFAVRPAAADTGDAPPDSGRPGRRYVIRGGSVMSMDPTVGDFPKADVLIEGKKILAVGPNLQAHGAG